MRHPVCFGYQIATPDVAYSPSLTCLHGDPERNIETLRLIGYDAVEFMTADPRRLDPIRYRAMAERFGMRCVLVCTGEVFGTLGLSFLDPNPGVRRRAADRIKELIDFAAALGANVNIGRVQGKNSAAATGDYADFAPAAEALIDICEYAKPLSVDILLEPIEKRWGGRINTVADGVKVCKKLGFENLRVMMDHSAMCFEEISIAHTVRRYAAASVGHLHLSEKDRRYPGHTSAAPFEALIGELRLAGYDGPFVVEALSLPEGSAAARKAYETIAPMLKKNYAWTSNN
ncbi:MAG: sugar phosphate isomerase/epimerase [Clostridiales Family XIII bacterium]|jgi:sugar phosphate isomerase/epimerase|nr:sugar phosphate isomerase/epimerase [Clostridiales Family XIII bacterium]